MEWVILETTFPEPLYFDPWNEENLFAEIPFLVVITVNK